MVVSVWFGLILIILFTAGIIDEWKRGGSANRMSIAEQEKYWKGECRRRNEDLKEELGRLRKETRELGEVTKELYNNIMYIFRRK